MAKPFRTVALFARHYSPHIEQPLAYLDDVLRAGGFETLLAQPPAAGGDTEDYSIANLDELAARADVALVLGGDGTLLNVARALSPHGIPLIGVNHGRLGFLTDVSLDNMVEVVTAILAGSYVEERRILLDTVVWRNDERVFEASALNDVAISKGASGRLTDLEVWIDGQFVYSVRADGLVVATPTGTTAYALSAGGPILYPTLEAIALVPVCPHTLSARPIAVESHASVRVEVLHATDVIVHFDGQQHFDLQVQDRVVIGRGANTAVLLHPRGHSYYAMLREKLLWGKKL